MRSPARPRRIAILAQALGLASAAHATTYNVPGNYGSIWGALNNVPTGSTVLVAPGTYAESITLGSFNRDITVIATGGPDVTTIDGGGTSRLLYINNSAITPSGQLVFHGFTFANGKSTTTGANGSPISINNSSPTFINCVFRNNRSSYKGGAILVFDGYGPKDTRVTFKDCLFDANKTDANGGGILGNGGKPFLVFDNCTFRKNTTRTSSSSNLNQGGALYLADAEALVSRCTFLTNSANYAAGGIGVLYGNWTGAERKLTVRDSTFIGNFVAPVSGRLPSSPPTSEAGGILCEGNVSVLVSQSYFKNHQADSGCTLHSYRAHLTVEDCVIEDGSTTASSGGVAVGGGISLNNNDAGDSNRREATLTVRNTLVRNCTCHGGGGIFIQGDLTYNQSAQVLIENTALIGNIAVENGPNSGFGSALRANHADVSFIGGFMADNHADIAGTVVAGIDGDIQIVNSFVVGNDADVLDDDFHIAGGSVTTPGSTVAYNGGSGTAATAGFLASPRIAVLDKVFLSCFVAPVSGSPTIQPAGVPLIDEGGYAAGLVEISGVDETTTYTLDSQYADIVQTGVWADVRRPYPGNAIVAPATIEAENYSAGGADVAYHDRTPGNTGGAGRTAEDVDVASGGGASGGAYLGWVVAGEYLDYAVDIPSTGEYTIAIRVASSGLGGKLHVEWNGQPVGSVFSVPDTGGWATWQSITQTGVVLGAGSGQLRLVMRANGGHGFIGNIDSVDITAPYDSDGDGIADAWELAHFVDLNVADAATDFDVDGVSDLGEFLAATDPLDADDYLHVSMLLPDGGGMTLRWKSKSNIVYRIGRSADLTGGFAVLATNVVATPPTNAYIDTIGPTAACFYQIQVE